MEILKIIEALQAYSEDVLAAKLDSYFAYAVSEAASLLVGQGEKITDLENALVGRRWIPVTERLPEKSGWYLVYTCSDRTAVMTFSAVNRAFNSFDDLLPDNAIECTHWMLLPEPPKEE